jgi:hypothetical protein
MIPPTTNELRMHSDNLADFGKDLHKLNGTGKALTNVAVVVVALIAIVIFLPPVFAEIV